MTLLKHSARLTCVTICHEPCSVELQDQGVTEPKEIYSYCFLYLVYLDIIHRLSFSYKTQRFRDWLCLRPQLIKKKRKRGGDPIWWVS
jgi:hypothetical protein